MTDTDTPLTLTADDFEATYDGISICCSGEDGDMLALGHHGKAAVLAAFNRHAREYMKIENIAADDTLTDAELAEYESDITAHWGVPRKATEAEQDNEGWSWTLERATADTPGATPYMYLSLT
jgi:hypothetical protein